MPRYNYPIQEAETGDLLGIATASEKAANMIVGYAERLSDRRDNPFDYETATHPDDLGDLLLETSEPHEELIRAFRGTEHVPEEDFTVLCSQVEVNVPLKQLQGKWEGDGRKQSDGTTAA